MPENFEIANMWVLWLLPLPLLVYWLLPPLRFRSSSLNLPDFKKAQTYTGEKPRISALIKKQNIISRIGIILIWILTIAALSSPRLVGKPEMKVKTSRNFLILTDMSFSMANTDWTIKGKKVRRWDAAKQVLSDFISKRKGDRMGIIFFGSSAYTQVPFTPDLKTVKQMLDEADVGMAGQMTSIGKAIVKGVELFRQDTIKTKIMLLLTDGVDAGISIAPLDAAEMAKRDSVIIYTIGIGDPDKPGVDLDETTLKQIAELTDGRYFRAVDAAQMAEIYDELDKLEPIEYEEESYKPTTLLYYYPLGLAVALGILLFLIFSVVDLFKKND